LFSFVGFIWSVSNSSSSAIKKSSSSSGSSSKEKKNPAPALSPAEKENNPATALIRDSAKKSSSGFGRAGGKIRLLLHLPYLSFNAHTSFKNFLLILLQIEIL
jgi:hypothetical protein